MKLVRAILVCIVIFVSSIAPAISAQTMNGGVPILRVMMSITGDIDLTATPNLSGLGAPTNFIGVINGQNIDLTWDAGFNSTGTLIRRGSDAFPADENDGTLVYQNNGTSVTDFGAASQSQAYYYSIWSYDATPIYMAGLGITIGGEGLLALANNILTGILIVFGFGLLLLGYVRRSFFITLLSFIACLILGGYSMSISSGTNIYYAIGLFAIFMALVALITSIGLAWGDSRARRAKAALLIKVETDDEAAARHKETREQKREKWQAIAKERKDRRMFR